MSQLDSPEFDKVSQYSVNSDFNFQSPLPLPKNPKHIPSNNQINESLIEIQEKFPDLPVDKVVSLLYNNLIVPKLPSEKAFSQAGSMKSYKSKSQYRSSQYEKLSPGEKGYKRDESQETGNLISTEKTKKQKEIKKQKKNPKGEHQQNLRKAQTWTQQQDKQHTFQQNEVPRVFLNKDDQIKYQQKKLVAKAFCQRGYGLNRLKELVWEEEAVVLQMDKRRYKIVTTTLINESYRNLQKFLIEDCQRNIKPLTAQQMRALYAILTNSQNKFEEDEYLTFRKFMKVTYDLGSVSIFQQSAIKMYIRIQISLRGRIGAMRLDRAMNSDFRPKKELLKSPGRFQNQRLQSESIWTAQLQADLIEAIAENRTIAKARDALKIKYGQNVILNNVKQLKGRFFKIIRIAVKRLIKYAQQYAHKVPLLVNVGDQKIKVIIRSPQAVDARIALGKLYKTTNFNAEILTEVINLVNQFCYLDETRKQSNQRQKQPVISSVTDKIKHNINISRKLLKNVTTPAQRAGDGSQLVFLKGEESNYQHIVSLQHNDKLHYFRKTGLLNKVGGYQYEQKPPLLKKLQMDDGDDDSSQLVMLSDQDD